MNKWTKITSAILLTTASSAVAAQEESTAPNFDYVSLSYLSADVDGDTASGFAASFNKSYSDNVFFAADYMTASDDFEDLRGDIAFRAEAEISRFYGNVGYKFYNEGNTAAYVSGGLAWVEAVVKTNTFGDYGANEAGWNLQVGIRSRLTEAFEIDASVRHYDVDNLDDQELNISGRYFVNSNFSLGVGYSLVNSEESHTFLTGAYHW
ncbi:outer membrane beta-barrel protein [Pseudidiomarina sp.]|uniref:outer membrane beta-barrel protein n=1 Tax=Pseudidiomarina sp. TaxID=2081707 RepID=UPI003A97A1FA